MLSTGPLVVIAFTVAFSVLTQKNRGVSGVLLGRWFRWWGLRFCAARQHYAAYATLVVNAVGELIQQPRITIIFRGWRRPAARDVHGLCVFAAGNGSFLAGRIGGALLHRFEKCSTGGSFSLGATAIGWAHTLLLWIYDRSCETVGTRNRKIENNPGNQLTMRRSDSSACRAKRITRFDLDPFLETSASPGHTISFPR